MAKRTNRVVWGLAAILTTVLVAGAGDCFDGIPKHDNEADH